jgi:sugar phosphate isomerase/epimerase
MTPALISAHRPISAHRLLGASTGYLREHYHTWEALVGAASAVSVFAAELAALGEDELPDLLAFLEEASDLPFRYLSVHAPSKRLERSEPERVALLSQLPTGIDAIVVHPDTIVDVREYRRLGSRLLIENMDDRKGSGRTAEELEAIFNALPAAGLCFDVAHASSIDTSMTAGGQILDAFAERLRHVHLSSLDSAGHHVPLRETDAERFHPLLDRCRDVPWVLEAPLLPAT